jgi:hypothetical protein
MTSYCTAFFCGEYEIALHFFGFALLLAIPPLQHMKCVWGELIRVWLYKGKKGLNKFVHLTQPSEHQALMTFFT